MVENIIEQKQNNNMSLMWIWGGILYVLFIGVLILIKANLTTFTATSFFIWFGMITLFFSASMLSYYFINRKEKINDDNERKNSKLPYPITTEEGLAYVHKYIRKVPYADYVETPEFNGVEQVGEPGFENTIYIFKGEGTFNDKKIGKPRNYAILINAHYPNRYTILVNATDKEISFAKNRLSLNPKDTPNKIIIQERNNILGTERITTTTSKDNKSSEQEKPKEDLK